MEAVHLGAHLAGRDDAVLDAAIERRWPRSRRSAPRSSGGSPARSTSPPAGPPTGAAGRRRRAHLVLRPRAVERVRAGRSPSTSRTPCARRRCCAGATAGSCSCPAPPGTVQEIFQDACENYYAEGADRRADGPRRRRALDAAPPGVAAARRAGPRSGHGGPHRAGRRRSTRRSSACSVNIGPRIGSEVPDQDLSRVDAIPTRGSSSSLLPVRSADGGCAWCPQRDRISDEAGLAFVASAVLVAGVLAVAPTAHAAPVEDPFAPVVHDVLAGDLVMAGNSNLVSAGGYRRSPTLSRTSTATHGAVRRAALRAGVVR